MIWTASAKLSALPARAVRAEPATAIRRISSSGLRFLAPFHIAFVEDLHSSNRALYAGGKVGSAVHAASFMRRRRIVLDACLINQPRELRRIVTHELFHFAWIRLGNPRRREWEAVVAAEWKAKARGELGWSAEWRKGELTPADPRRRTRRWRDYACESFCDTAAWLLIGAHSHPEVTLALRHRTRRAQWFVRLLRGAGVKI